MALNIPMPGLPGDALLRGLETGSGLFSRYMQPILQRESQAQQAQQFGANLGQRQSEQAQAQENFLKELALKQQAANRMAQNANLQREMHALQMQKLRNELNPDNKINQWMRLQKLFSNHNQGNQQIREGESFINPIKTQENKPEFDFEEVKHNPFLAAGFKDIFGVNPYEKEKIPTAKDIAQTEYMNKRAKSFAYSTAPVDMKNYMLAQAAGMGIAPDKAVNEFTNGKTIEDLAKEHGFDPENLPEPDFAPTRGNITKLNERKAALGEMKHLSNFVIEGLGPYTDTVLGWSPEQTWDQLNHMNKDKQIKFIAARGIVPELTNMRLMTAGAKNTVHAIKAMQDKSMLNIRQLQSGVDPDVWKSAQRLMDKELEQAMQASMSKFRLKTKSERNEEKESNSKDLIFNPVTGRLE